MLCLAGRSGVYGNDTNLHLQEIICIKYSRLRICIFVAGVYERCMPYSFILQLQRQGGDLKNGET